MSYTKKTWETGDTITADALNNLETGASDNASAIAEIQQALPTYVGKNVKRKAAETFTPTASDQTISAEQYLTGDQIIKGDVNLIADNIRKGKSVFGVNGALDPGPDTGDATAAAADILSGKTAYANGVKITGSIPSKEAASYMPGTADQSITSGQYLEGTQTIKGDANLAAENIKKDTVIFGVTGSLEIGTDTSDATAEAADIMSGKTAYVKGEKITGTLPAPTILRASPSAITEATIRPTTGVGSSYKEITMKASSLTISGKCVVDADNTDIRITAKATEFGDATAADVAEGKTFTSAAGLKVKGTKAASSSLDTSDATATAGDIVSGKTAYVNGTKVTGTISKKAAATITPGTADQTIASGQYLSGAQTIEGDANLIADNIKKGVSIFGVIGTLESGGGSGSSGAAVKTGTFTGNAGAVEVETGLSSISHFIAYDASKVIHAQGLVVALADTAHGVSGFGVACSSYSQYSKNISATSSGILTISGGTVSFPGASTTNAPISNATYNWAAIGEE